TYEACDLSVVPPRDTIEQAAAEPYWNTYRPSSQHNEPGGTTCLCCIIDAKQPRDSRNGERTAGRARGKSRTPANRHRLCQRTCSRRSHSSQALHRCITTVAELCY